MRNNERSVLLKRAEEPIDEPFREPQALLEAVLHLRQEIVQEARETFKRWRPLIRRRAFLPSGYNLAVMLNKGPYVAEAVTALDHVITRMQNHQMKKTPQLRTLHMWQQGRGKRH